MCVYGKEGTYQFLEVVCGKFVRVVDDIVMRRASGTLQTLVSLKVEVEVVDGRDPAVDDCARHGVSRLPIRAGGIGRIEPGVMPLANNDDGDLRPIVGVTSSVTGRRACLHELRKLKLIHLVELALRDTITIDNDVVGQGLAVAEEPEPEAFHHHRLHIRNHLPNISPTARQAIIDANIPLGGFVANAETQDNVRGCCQCSPPHLRWKGFLSCCPAKDA